MDAEALFLGCSECGGSPLELTPRFEWHCPRCSGLRRPVLLGAPEDLEARILADFPFPLALLYQRVTHPENATTGLLNLVAAYTSLIRFSTLVLVSQFLRSDLIQPQAAQAVVRLRVPALDSWQSGLFTLAKRLFSRGQGGAGATPFCEGLVKGVAAFDRARAGKQKLAEAMREFRNDQQGHRSTWSESQCAAQLADWKPVLDWVYALFLPLAEITVLRRDTDSECVVMRGVSEPLPREPLDGRDLASAFAESDVLLRNAAGEILPLYPLFVMPERTAERYLEDLLAFDGHGLYDMTFRGVPLNSLRLTSPWVKYRDMLARKEAVTRLRKEYLRPWKLSELAFATTETTIQSLLGSKYFPEYYQERRGGSGTGAGARGVDDTVREWLERRPECALLVAASAGGGKTSLLCHLAEELLAPADSEQGEAQHMDCVLLLVASAVRGGPGALFQRIREGLLVSGDKDGVSNFAKLLDAWRAASRQDDAGDARRLIILLDAVNESEEVKALLEEVNGLAEAGAAANRRAGRVWVRFLVTARTERLEALWRHWGERHDTSFLAVPQNFAHYEYEGGRRAPYLTLRPFSPVEASRAYQRAQVVMGAKGQACPAGWERLAPGTRALLEAPQMLALFHQVYAGHEQPPAVASQSKLWEAWLDKTLDPKEVSRANLGRVALELANVCIDGGYSMAPDSVAAAWRRRWEEGLNNRPAEIAAGMDELERLAHAGCCG